jgi:hypothetical protein
VSRVDDDFEDFSIKLEHDDQQHQTAARTPYAWRPETPNRLGRDQFQDFMDDEDDSSNLYSPFPAAEESPDTVEGDTGALILKGLIYPGMAGFDSATERDRRMRNQKKDPTVLLKLESNSELVTRNEQVLDTSLNHQRTRDVYDEPSIDGSMVSRN